ncbi:D-serine ammonia-lyase, partial [Priestia megaterium]
MENYDVETLKVNYPLLNHLISLEELFWINPNLEEFDSGITKSPVTKEDVRDAEERLKRFAPYIATVFPETKESNGII